MGPREPKEPVICEQPPKYSEDKDKTALQNHGKKNGSKLPRIIRISANFCGNKELGKVCGQLDVPGSESGAIKLTNCSTKVKIEDSRSEVKPSQIPRLKSSSKEVSKDNTETKRETTGVKFVESRNVHRVHLLNTSPDFSHEDRTLPSSVAATKPIPTLGQIYRRNNVTDNNRLNDWLVETDIEYYYLNTPPNSLESNPTSVGTTISRNTILEANDVLDNVCHNNIDRPPLVFDNVNLAQAVYTSTNENKMEWLTSEVDTARDNESGYRSMSPPSHAPINTKSKHSTTTMLIGDKSKENQFSNSTIKSCSEKSSSSTKTTDIGKHLTEQPTVLINRNVIKPNNTTNVNDTSQGSEFSKNFQYPSINKPNSTKVEPSNIPVPSYVDCASEILQKTTNFEIDGCESPRTLSSIAGTDLEMRDDYSSRYTLEQTDDNSMNEDRSQVDWCRRCTSHSSITFIKSTEESADTTLVESSYCQYHDQRNETSDAFLVNDSDRIRHHHHHFWKRDFKMHYNSPHGDTKNHCKRHKSKRFPSSRFNINRPFESLRCRLSIRRICRRRWNSMWKKTTERWSHWSRPSKVKKIRLIHYIQRSIIWEDANVQTTLLVYQETGTGSALKELKSAGITTSFKWTPLSAIGKKIEAGTSSGSSNKSRVRRVNLGPSMFPFFHNSKKSSTPLQKITETSKAVPRFNSFPQYSKQNGHVQNKTVEIQTETELSRATEDKPTHVDIETANNNTATEDTSKLEEITSTMLHLSKFKTFNNSSKDVYTQMIITCNNAETDLRWKESGETLASSCDNDVIPFKQVGINTDADYRFLCDQKHFIDVMTSHEVIKETVDSESQVTPAPSLSRLSTGISTSRQIHPEKISTAVSEIDIPVEVIEKRSLATETSNEPILSLTGTRITSISSARMQPVSVAMSRQEVASAGVLTKKASVRSGNCLTSQSIQRYCCPQPELKTHGTEIESEVFACVRSTSTKGLGTFVDTGITVEGLVEQVSFGGGSRHHSFISLGTELADFNQKSAFMVTSTVQCNDKDIEMCPEYSSVSTSTHTVLQSKSVGQSPSNVDSKKSVEKRNKTDVFIQHSQHLERNEQYRSACIGHSRLISSLVFSGSVNEAATQADPDDFESVSSMICGMGDSHRITSYNEPGNVEAKILEPMPKQKSASVYTSQYAFGEPVVTNTIIIPTKDTMCSGQDLSHCWTQVDCNNHVNTQTDESTLQKIPKENQNVKVNKTQSRSSKASARRSHAHSINGQIDSRLISLSRLIGQTKSNTRIRSSSQPINYPQLSSNLNPSKWIKSCGYNTEKDYLTLLANEQAALDPKHSPLPVNNSSKVPSNNQNPCTNISFNQSGTQPDLNCAITPPLVTLSTDSLADVIPIQRSLKTTTIANADKKIMLDKNTSDVPLNDSPCKDIKESILQVQPDVTETATESLVNPLKSASVLTSKYILPAPLTCRAKDCNGDSVDCIFVYDRPHCTVHRQQTDAAVQMDPPPRTTGSGFIRQERVKRRSVGLLTSRFDTRSSSIRRVNDTIGEVLPPKVYKALYETTKLIGKEDSLYSNRSTLVDSGLHTEIDPGVTYDASLHSAGIITSSCDYDAFGTCCCKEQATEPDYMRYEPQTAAEGTTQTLSNCRAKLLELPRYDDTGFAEECAKTHLVGSCRYYSNLLTKQLGRVKDNLTRHLAPSTDNYMCHNNTCRVSILPPLYGEACTMKPSGREDLSCQTRKPYTPTFDYHPDLHPLGCICPTMSLTEVNENDRNNLKSVYYMLTAIEGRLRRLKSNLPS